VDKSYDAMGRVYTVSNPYRPGDSIALTTYLYDTLGRMKSVTTPDGAVTSTSYSGQYQVVNDAAGKSKRYWYDAAGRLYNVLEDPNGVQYTTDYRYDALDNLLLVSQGACPNCRPRQYTYDALSRLTQATSPESGTVNYSYDGNGNLTGKTDARGIKTTFAYDALNRLVSKTYSDSTPVVTYVYDDPAIPHSTDQLTQVANGSSVTKYLAFDALGRPTGSQQVTSDETYTFSYGYNLAGALTSETYPSGRVVSTGYDGANRPSAVTGMLSTGQTTYTSGVTYAPHGGIAGFAMGNGVTPWFGYNNRLQMTTAQATVGASSSAYLFAEQPSWGTTNNNGNLQGETVWKGGPAPLNSLPKTTQSYGYDTLNRLTAASDSSGWSRQFGYDAWGNMWVTANSGVNLAGNTPTANVYNSNNQMRGASYDAAGNLLLANGFTLGYDAENRQVSATEQPSLGSGQELYLYDGDGQRVEKIAPAGNTIYVYDAFGQLAAEYNTFGNSFACTTCYVMTDHVGSVRMVTDQNGTAVTRHDYLPFGEEIQGSSPSSEVEQRFTGQIRDAETGMDFFNARYFTAPLGRFNSADPESAGAFLADPQTWNGYSYVRGNPMNSNDPSGACSVFVAGITMSPENSTSFNSLATSLGANQAYPYSGLGTFHSIADVIGQAMTDNTATDVAYNAIERTLATNPGNIDILAYSGGAASTTAAINLLSPAARGRIGNVVYVSPGAAGRIFANNTTSEIRGTGPKDVLAMSGTEIPLGVPVTKSSCGHTDFACLMRAAQSKINLLKKDGPCSQSIVVSRPPPATKKPKEKVTSTITYGQPTYCLQCEGYMPAPRPVFTGPM
jgi:RHS repeat-associated protein